MEHLIWAAPLTAMVALVGFVFNNNHKNDSKVTRIYTRLDEVKSYHEDKFQSKEVCSIIQKRIEEKIDRIDKNVEKLVNGK